MHSRAFKYNFFLMRVSKINYCQNENKQLIGDDAPQPPTMKKSACIVLSISRWASGAHRQVALEIMSDKKLTDENIKKTKVGDTLWCRTIKGLHLRHRQNIKKTFHLKYRVGHQSKQKRPWIQNYAPPHYTLSSARDPSEKTFGRCGIGARPNGKSTKQRQCRAPAITFAELADNFIELYCKKNLADKTLSKRPFTRGRSKTISSLRRLRTWRQTRSRRK